MKSNKNTIKVVSRKSNLALLQVGEIFTNLPELKYQLVGISSFGDNHKEISLLDAPPADIFTREIDEAILNGEADIAIHSAKDLPFPLREGLEVIALTSPLNQSDSLVSKNKLKLAELPEGARVGTSSPVRRRELLERRPDLTVVSIRGTIEERIDLVDKGEIDALIVATCALNRLGLDHRIAEELPFETHPLQGHLAVVARKDYPHKNLFQSIDSRLNYGKVVLAGFGPGNPDLITVASLNALKSAEVICFDDLTNKEFLNQFSAEKMYVGKRKDCHSYEQFQINRILLDYAKKGKSVVRLKGGDPMVFAHGGEETSYLRENWVEVESIPGISAGIALASLTQVPLTHRGLSSSVAFISGHTSKVKLPDTDSVVIYMGGSHIREIAANAITNGRNPETPVLLVHNLSLPGQIEFRYTLGELSEKEIQFPTPIIILLGDVVQLYVPKTPMKRRNILVTGTTVEHFPLNGSVTHQPLIEIKPIAENALLEHTIEHLNDFDWLCFTSRFSVRFFFEKFYAMGLDVRSLAGVQIASVGKVTSDALKENGIIPELQPEDESSAGLLKMFEDLKIEPGRILIPRSNIGLPVLPEGLKKLNWDVKTVALYENVMPENLQPLDLKNIDEIVFSSPSCVSNFLRLYSEFPDEKDYIFRGKETEKRFYQLKGLN